MENTIFLLCLILVPVMMALSVAKGKDRVRLFITISLFGTFFLSVLSIMNDVLPFAGGGGDDKNYFDVSKRTFESLGDWFDLTQFKRTHEQAGYPLLLSWVHQVFGGSLFHRKALNVCFFLLLAIVWFMIGNVMGGRGLAFVYASGILICTPLWYYWIFLLKDMTITLLQSLFLLGIVFFLSQNSRVRGYSLLALSTVAILPFRSMLALVNLASLACSTFVLRPGSQKIQLGILGKAAAVATIMVFVFIIGSQPEYLRILGVGGEHRSLDYESVQKSLEIYEGGRVSGFTNIIKFSFVYLVGEVAAFNPKSWNEMNSTLIRSVSMLPWIYLGLPLFLTGVWLMFHERKAKETVEATITSNDEETTPDYISPPKSYLFILLIFIMMYAGISWVTGDTTRWRMPSMPPMIALAGYAWVELDKTKRFHLLFWWGWSLSVSLIIYYIAFK